MRLGGRFIGITSIGFDRCWLASSFRPTPPSPASWLIEKVEDKSGFIHDLHGRGHSGGLGIILIGRDNSKIPALVGAPKTSWLKVAAR